MLNEGGIANSTEPWGVLLRPRSGIRLVVEQALIFCYFGIKAKVEIENVSPMDVYSYH